MDTASACLMGIMSRGCEPRVFDWDKAAAIIKESNVRRAAAGLAGDWEYTGGEIFRNGEPVDKSETYTFLASTWATPVLEIDDETDIECWRYESETPGWDADTYWPESALKILNGESEGE